MSSELIPGTDQYNLRRRYLYLERREKTGWDSFEHFAKWSKENGHFRGAFLRRIELDKPHGPDNCFWSASPAYYYSDTRAAIPNESSFCVGCKSRKRPELCSGCDEWEKWYVDNWNRNIHVDLTTGKLSRLLTDGTQRPKFRYEHPEFEREQKKKNGGNQNDV